MHSGHIEGNDLHKRKANLIKSLFFQEEDNLPINLVKSEESDLEKGAGEGSRGGRIIGHTKNGKPIYGGTMLGGDATPHPLDAHMAAHGYTRMGELHSHGSPQEEGRTAGLHAFESAHRFQNDRFPKQMERASIHVREHSNGKFELNKDHHDVKAPMFGHDSQENMSKVRDHVNKIAADVLGKANKERGVEED